MPECKITRSQIGRYKVSFYNQRAPSIAEEIYDEEIHLTELRDYSDEALKRAKRQVIEYGENNPWTFFVTITFDKRKIDRDNLPLLYKRIRKFMNNYQQRYDKSMKYLLVPEFHADEVHLHWHGLIYFDDYTKIKDIEEVTVYNRKKRKYETILRSKYMFNAFGACRFDNVATSPLYVSAYISKYITKQNIEVFGTRYVCSKGLKTSEDVVQFETLSDIQQALFRCTTLCDVNGEIIPPVTKTRYCLTYSLDETQFKMLFPELN